MEHTAFKQSTGGRISVDVWRETGTDQLVWQIGEVSDAAESRAVMEMNTEKTRTSRHRSFRLFIGSNRTANAIQRSSHCCDIVFAVKLIVSTTFVRWLTFDKLRTESSRSSLRCCVNNGGCYTSYSRHWSCTMWFQLTITKAVTKW